MDLDSAEEKPDKLPPLKWRELVQMLVHFSHQLEKFGRINDIIFRKGGIGLEIFDPAFNLDQLGLTLLDPAL